MLTNNKYFSIIEARAMAMAAILEVQPDNVNAATAPLLLDFIKWVFEAATKNDIKQALYTMWTFIYELDDGMVAAVECANQIVRSAALMKTVGKYFADSDMARGMEPRVQYVTEPMNQTSAGRLVIVSTTRNMLGTQQNQEGVQCEFCFYKAQGSGSAMMQDLYRHVASECPCCGICPACHLVVELAFLSVHLAEDCQGVQAYQYKLQKCQRCNLVFDAQLFEQHVRECQVQLNGDFVCALCNMQLQQGLELEHYDPSCGGCNANPRTAENLQKII